ncbi:signal transduction histidine kinase [Variovorax boronicumulans]|uniref:histidine kinase n=1 Tax=Variovorax boronicumulans TaxID=436515 RepID=A0AAW8DB67_9BURK|nr:HAMP domain-containing sensor histidine kinase [Variovorax boronicumulans]MDP9897348.1 signal transduction histidine kinase [Variovorax boronicumulans]MDQ0057418.1 signal transduction histidine kinase [Variovorax boronicumulans]
MTAFSKFHHFTQDDIEKSVEITSQQGTASKALLNVTTGHRNLVGRQFLLQQIAYWITVGGLAIAEASAPLLSEDTMRLWMIVTAVSWVFRILIYLPVYYLPPAVVAKSLFLKASPLAIILVACGYWMWTIPLFAGPVLTVRELFMCIGFLAISISMTGIFPVTPIAVIVYISVLWGSLSFSMYTNQMLSAPLLFAMNSMVLVILGLYVFISISQVKTQLNRSDQVDILNAELVSTNEVLQSLKNAAYTALETRSVFFAQANHDFKQHLHGAKLMVVAALATTKPGEAAHGALQRLGEEMDSLEVYMNNVLDFARIESLDAGTQLRSTKIQSLFQKLDLHFEEIAISKQVNLNFRPTNIRIGTDASMLYRMLENLISNALKFTRKGGGVLVTARARAGGIYIEVWDQGPGIKTEAQHRIFDAFHQEVPASGPRQPGIGLGLAIVQRFAGRLGYRIQIHSVVGRGTVFRVIIPREFLASESIST